MFRSVQSWTGTACIFCLYSIVTMGAGMTVIRPIIDRPGVCTYCGVVAEAFSEATESIDLLLANAELENNPLWGPLISACNRGVRVRVLLDESDWAASINEKNGPTLDYLLGHGVEAAFDDPAVTTHAKMVVVDRTTVILGSTNWNQYAFTDQEQANVCIVDGRVGGAFADWFDGLWAHRGETWEHGVAAVDVPKLHGPSIVLLPDEDGFSTYVSAVLPLLDSAGSSIHVALYRMSVYMGFPDSTANELLDALVRAARRGIDVRVLLDDCSFYADSAEANLASALYLFEHGIPVRFDRPEETTHAKLLVIDGQNVILGSTNWNYYALERNVEASVALLGMTDVADVFDDYFEALWRAGRPIGP